MLPYTKTDARDWARERLKGAANIVIASYTDDLARLNESGIRHDVRLEIERGFLGFLVVAETTLSLEEYVRFTEIAVDEAGGQQLVIHHASFNTLQENIEAARRAAIAGAELALLSYPPSFYPLTEKDIEDYTRAFCDAVDIAVMLFPVPLWGFERIHPASLSIDLLRRLVDDVPNIVAIKAEGGYPYLGGFAEVWDRLRERVVISLPLASDAIPVATLLPLEFMGTSNYEFFGAAVPQMLQAAREGRNDDAMALYWQIDAARRIDASAGGVSATNTVNRMAWKYQAWLNGFNGGPLRMPTPRISAPQMQAFRRGLHASGLLVTDDPDEAFFVGRNPA
jgi:4-hydroxy-tetrahydrodipicolinate synthase